MSYRLSRLLPPFEEVAAAIPELEVDLRGGAEDDLDDDVGGVAKKRNQSYSKSSSTEKVFITIPPLIQMAKMSCFVNEKIIIVSG